MYSKHLCLCVKRSVKSVVVKILLPPQCGSEHIRGGVCVCVCVCMCSNLCFVARQDREHVETWNGLTMHQPANFTGRTCRGSLFLPGLPPSPSQTVSIGFLSRGMRVRPADSSLLSHFTHVLAPVRLGSAPIRDPRVLNGERSSESTLFRHFALLVTTYNVLCSHAIHPLSPPSDPSINCQLQSSSFSA